GGACARAADPRPRAQAAEAGAAIARPHRGRRVRVLRGYRRADRHRPAHRPSHGHAFAGGTAAARTAPEALRRLIACASGALTRTGDGRRIAACGLRSTPGRQADAGRFTVVSPRFLPDDPMLDWPGPS